MFRAVIIVTEYGREILRSTASWLVLPGINIPDKKHVVIALQSIYGVGLTRAKAICDSTDIAPESKVRDLVEVDLEKLRVAVGELSVEGDCAVKLQ